MDFLSFIFGLLCLVSIDTIIGFVVYTLWKYFDMKYFSEFEISKLKIENEYLKQENAKVNGASNDFWRKDN